jgi:hypothetical protein
MTVALLVGIFIVSMALGGAVLGHGRGSPPKIGAEPS